MMNDKLKLEIQEYAIKKYPQECCGFLMEDEFIPVQNIHPSKLENFKVSPKDWYNYALECKAFIHSHPDWYPCPSEGDMRQQIASAVPWGIVSTDGKRASEITFFGDQGPTPDILNRTFCHGVTDCYSIIRDWYKLERGIILDEIPRSWEWWDNSSKDLYKDNFGPVGFKKVPYEQIMDEGPQVGDVFLANIGPGVVKLNHGGVYIGNGLGIHHLTGKLPVENRLAKRDPINRWLKRINMWVRYEKANNTSR